LKDRTRSKLDDVHGNIGWAELPRRVGRHGEQEAWFSFKREEYANACYGLSISVQSRHKPFLTLDTDLYGSSNTVRVHLFKTSLKGQAHYERLKCNCSLHFAGVSPGGHSPNRSGIDFNEPSRCWYNQGAMQWPQTATQPPRMTAAPIPAAPMTALPFNPGPAPNAMAGNSLSLSATHMTATPSAYTYQTYPQVYPYPQNYAMYPPTQIQAPTAPIYSPSQTGVVNGREGVVITESRGVFITGLSYSVGTNELAALFRDVGSNPTERTLIKDSTGKFRGKASAKFKTPQEAQAAVSRLNNSKHMGKTIRVKLDAEGTVVGQIQGPVVVNGSNFPRVRLNHPPSKHHAN
jgi:hypothetical protein